MPIYCRPFWELLARISDWLSGRKRANQGAPDRSRISKENQRQRSYVSFLTIEIHVLEELPGVNLEVSRDLSGTNTLVCAFLHQRDTKVRDASAAPLWNPAAPSARLLPFEDSSLSPW